MSITRLADSADFYARFEKVPAPDTKPLDPTLDAWTAILAGINTFRQQIQRAESVSELVQLRGRVTILSGELAELADTAGTLADAVIARRS